MQVKNKVAVGMLVGLVVPLLAYFFSEILLDKEIMPAKPGVPYLIAVCINLIFIKYAYKANADKTGAGIIIITFIVLMLSFAFKIKLR